MLNQLQIQRISFTLYRSATATDPHCLFRLRTHYQAALAAVSQCAGNNGCAVVYTCPYHTAFGQELSTDPELVRRHQKPPHPFAFQHILTDISKPPGTVEYHLVLVGRAVNHLVAHLQALRRIFNGSESAGYEITAITLQGLAGAQVAIPLVTRHELPEIPLLTWGDLVQEAGEPPEVVTLTLQTPLRLLAEGRLATNFNPSLFLRQVVRRCSALADCYGEELLDTDFKALAVRSRQVELLEQEIRLSGAGTATAGLTGTATLAGNLWEFWPWLVLGQWVNVGKGAAFGLGRFSLLEIQ